MIIEATTPNRIDLAGGTLDIYPLYLFEEYGITVNVAIDLGSYVRLETRPDDRIVIRSEDTGAGQEAESLGDLELGGELDLLARVIRFYRPEVGLDVVTRNKAPKGSGLGSSSSLLIALSGALVYLNTGFHPGQEVIEYGQQLEAQNLRIPTGRQDYFPALYGGVSAIWFRVQGDEREALVTSERRVRELESRVILSFTGQPRPSGATNWTMLKAYIENDSSTTQSMKNIKSTALAVRECLMEWDMDRFAGLVSEEWENRKKLAEGVTTPRIEELVAAARQGGALASKVCGAGGGGCMISVVDPSDRDHVVRAIEATGAQVLDYSISMTGLELSRE